MTKKEALKLEKSCDDLLTKASGYICIVSQALGGNLRIQFGDNNIAINKYDLDSNGTAALVVVSGDRDVTLYPDYEFSSYEYLNGSYVTVDLTEESITNAIINVSTEDPTKVYFVTGHGEYVTDYLTEMTSSLEDVVYDCEELNLISATEIPEDCDILVFINPESDISEAEAEIVRTYANNGGDMFVSWFKEISQDADEFPNFQSVLDLYGAGIERGLLYEGSSSNYYYYHIY